MEQNLLSVIVPIYNVESYLEKCIESILGQTYRNLEIILVDDGSTDRSGDICDEYQKKDVRIKVIHKQNEGLVKTRKVGFSYAKGTYIGWVDADDWIEPDMYEKLMKKVQEYNCDIVLSGRIEEFERESVFCVNKVKEGFYVKEQIKTQILPKMLWTRDGQSFNIYPTVWDKVFRREILEKVLPGIPEDIRVGEDVACVYPAILEANSIYILGECLYHYIKYRTTSLLHLKDPECFKRIYSIQNYLREVFQNVTYPNNLIEQLDSYIWDLAVGSVHKEYGVYNRLFTGIKYLFPYELVRVGSKIILYGAGKVGVSFMQQLKHNRYCEVIAWTDKKWESHGIDDINCIKNAKCDYIVIAVANQKISEEIINFLLQQGITREKIVWSSYSM